MYYLITDDELKVIKKQTKEKQKVQDLIKRLTQADNICILPLSGADVSIVASRKDYSKKEIGEKELRYLSTFAANQLDRSEIMEQLDIIISNAKEDL